MNNVMFPRFLVYSIFILPMFGFIDNISDRTNSDPCDKIKVSIEIKESSSNTFIVNVTVKGAKDPIRYFFSDDKDLLNTNYTQSSMEFLKKGKYTCLVREAGGCRKLTEFEVK